MLTLAYSVPSGVSPADIVAHVDDNGQMLLLETPIPSSSSSSNVNMKHASVKLLQTVDPNTVKAKVNKKKNTLKITAQCL